ncbi:MAG: hypothetical protein IJ646_03630 [Clostridia bacterium]|nr:hypothetical protein [Clostridia bacterium]
MGVISILLGIIALIGFAGGGAVLGNAVIGLKTEWGSHLTALNNISNTGLMIGIIGLFAFIGLLICVSLVMQGITYNKVVKIQRRVKHL